MLGKMKSRLAFWVYLRRALRSLILAFRIMHPGGEIGQALRELFARAGVPWRSSTGCPAPSMSPS